MKARTIGVIAIGQVVGRGIEDYVSPMADQYGGLIGSVKNSTIVNAAVGVLGSYYAAKMKGSDEVKLAGAIIGTRLLTDVVMDLVKGYIPSAGLYRPTVRVATVQSSYSGNGGGLVTVD
jgi:hypothetical protein